MPLPVSAAIPLTPLDERAWPALASVLQRWLQAQGIEPRDAVWLMPFSALLPQARRALAGLAGWPPRVETLATLAAQLAPRPGLVEGVMATDPVTRRLQAAALLRQQPLPGREEAWRDPAALAHAVGALVDTAQTWADALAAQPPAQRPAWLAQARSLLAAGGGPGELERALARCALDWVAASQALQPPATDLLFETRPSAWIGLRVGGAQPQAEALLAAAAAQGVPVLWMDLDPPPQARFEQAATLPPPTEICCADAETEARTAAAEVLAALHRHAEGSVALIAQDREGVRRVRALLERAGVAVVDDTGWRVATTRAGARAMGLLRAARSLGSQGAGAEDLHLAWLKDDLLGRREPEALRLLELLWRGRRLGDEQRERAQALWARARQRLAPLAEPGRRLLSDWLALLGPLWLDDPEEAARWRDDPAGRAVLAAWRLEAPWNQAAGWRSIAGSTRFSLDELIRWADEALTDASVVPESPPQARVVVTPLARAMLRPFVAAVCPGADERRLGVVEPAADLLGPALRRSLGIPGADEARQREALAFVQLLRLPSLRLLRRTAEGAEPLGPSTLVQQLVLARQCAGLVPAGLPRAEPALPQRVLPPQPVAEPAPVAPAGRWPGSLSASAVEAWRDCPYRFFGRHLLGLAESDELDTLVDKREYGTWLHAVLLQFHQGRAPLQPLEDDLQRLHQAAQAVLAQEPRPEGEMLPFLASFEALCRPYLAWLARREQQGWVWQAGELDRRTQPAALAPLGLGLHGRLDRLDRDGQGVVQLLDYKTGSAARLQQKLRDPQEDTQLAFYAALALAHGDAAPEALQAAYLAMDEREGPLEVPHPQVARDAQAMLGALAEEFGRARAGEPLRALGRGEACGHCEMRGLCRRDQWSAPPDEAAEAVTSEGEA